MLYLVPDTGQAFGEILADLAQAVLIPKDRLIYPEQLADLGPIAVARIKLALDFWRKGPAFVFRAIFEYWDHQRLILEVYT